MLGFNRILTEINDIAGQHETVAEKLTTTVILTLQSSIQDIKQERKKVPITDLCCAWFYKPWLRVKQNYFEIIVKLF